MTNWGLIEATLDTAISDAECALAQRRKDYAGFEHMADLPQHEEELQDARRARDEVAKLKKLIAEAPVVTLALANGDDLTILSAENAEDWAGIDVRMLKLGDGDHA